MSTTRTPIQPNPQRWKPSGDPSSIVVPGLDTNSSTIDQIEQIEQLITIKLQNIDENFSKIHNVLSNKLLPAVKRYAVGTEPVREAAKFWTAFYEQAAQIRIPTYEDYSAENETAQEATETQPDAQESTTHPTADETIQHLGVPQEPSIVTSESSFMPAHAAFSSTPAVDRHAGTTTGNLSEDPSWTASIESPLLRLNREIQNFSLQPNGSSIIPSTTVSDDSRDASAYADRTLSRPDKGKGKESSQGLLKGVLRHNLYNASEVSSGDVSSVRASPLKPKGKPKTPIVNKQANPYLSDKATPADWRGVVDLRDPSVLSPLRPKPGQSVAGTPQRGRGADESFDDLPAGMSPPVLILSPGAKFTKKNASPYKLGRTPTKEPSARGRRDLLRYTQIKNVKAQEQASAKKAPGSIFSAPHAIESSSSTLPTPPSYSRYTDSSRSISKDQSINSMMRQIQDDMHSDTSPHPPSSRSARRNDMDIPEPLGPLRSESSIDDSLLQHDYTNPATPLFHPHPHHLINDGMDSDSDSMDEINNTAHPSAAFLMASQGAAYDDSFGSNQSSDSLEDEAIKEGLQPVHPFAQSVEDDGFDDSFDDEEDARFNARGGAGYQEETVFGVPPAQREQAMRFGQPSAGLRMMGEELLEDTIGIGAQMAASGKVEESPTPAWKENYRG